MSAFETSFLEMAKAQASRLEKQGKEETAHVCVLRELCFKSKEITTVYTMLVTDADIDIDVLCRIK
ncbi:hypothetical protein DPMN_084492 [Dreissena polymorpha]|uniref:Uncharacterized protein n=1 Tax=Dreissena polymorpha TaxID=45954 RepID=A0A9D3YEN2_DREPO|nr:hypothetical protein DPMN_084492 [Dreissena polymorpha]